MAASGADIRDILSLPGPSSIPAHAAPKKPPKAQKPEGISRELYSLIGDHAPSLAAVQRAKPKLKQKPDLGRGKVRWEWRPFTNSARKDSLRLGHWEKVREEQPAAYPFAKYNTSSTVYSYTEEEYATLLKDEEWTQEETDYLFSLVKEYDMRFYIIADRYDFPGGPGRSLEDLKARYYSVCRKLIRSRPWTGDESAKISLLNSYQFDKERERTRKMYVASLFARTPEQIAEEEGLYVEIKRLEQTERRFAKEREDLMKTVAGIESGLNVHQPDEEAFSGLFIDPRKKKKRGDGLDGDSPSSAGPSSAPPRKVLSAKQIAQDALNCITREDASLSTAPSTKTTHLPAHLRSSRMPYPKASIAPKVTALLAELGVSLTRLVMPTKDNIQLMESVVEAAAALIDTKKSVDRLEQEIKTQKKLLGLVVEEDVQDGAGEGEEESGGGRAGDVPANEDGTADVMEVDREESSSSHKRSLSISSVETSATAATRASRSTKRARKT
ncbi:SWR1-complex protein 4 [Hysterangium stoloniferum]|nr:SWR1-complex protein 4 [Hysterangium stoloniferum]